ncbi:MAG: cation:dicarboxylase symporter family transporter [Atopobiaceae bacterium]|nr:cation:dicarboxylase symporter family transporter [Atopobiaceae bacterium]
MKRFPEAEAFIEEVFERRHVNASIAYETMQLFEALFSKIVFQVGEQDAEIEISSLNGLGHTDIKLVFPGKRFLASGGDVSIDPEAKIIEAFSDKMSCSYTGGYNVIRISVGKSARSFILPNLIAIIAALVVSIVFALTLDDAGHDMVVKEWIAPLQKLFTNAVLMIGAPMTLFSLLKNVTDSFIVSERHSAARKLFAASVVSSLVAIALALIMGFTFARAILEIIGETESVDIGLEGWTLSSAVDQIIPSSILEPFQSISPVPMIVVALLVASALCNMGQNFDIMKRAIDACYDLFSSILSIVMAAFPLACFLLFLEVLMSDDGFMRFVALLLEAIVVFVCTIPFLATYALRLKARGVKVTEFARKLWPLVKENFVIGSVIDAVPYNTRYCAKVFGFSRSRLEKELPVLSQTSLDGNCFILMLLATIFIFVANCPVSRLNVVVVALIVLFLSFGAPNQPGSILIGMLIILTYLNSSAAVSMALCFELFCGALQNILNVISSIVMVTEGASRDTNA